MTTVVNRGVTQKFKLEGQTLSSGSTLFVKVSVLVCSTEIVLNYFGAKFWTTIFFLQILNKRFVINKFKFNETLKTEWQTA